MRSILNPFIRFLLLFALVTGICVAVSHAAQAQGGSGQATQSRVRDRKPPQKDDSLQSYLPREPSVRKPRIQLRGGSGPPIRTHLDRGEAEYQAGRNAAAVPELKEAVKESPDSYDSHYLLALTLTETGELEQAINEFKKAIALATKDDSKIVGYYNMANAYFDLGDYQNAADAYQSSVKIDASLSKVHNNLGLALVGLKRTSDAAAEFKRAVELKPAYAEARYNLGIAYLKLGNKSEASSVANALSVINAELAAKLQKLINP